MDDAAEQEPTGTDSSVGADRPPPPEPLLPVGSRPRRWRRVLSNAVTVLVAITLTFSLVLVWVTSAVFDADEFANRTAQLLRSAQVREAVATEIVDEIIENGGAQLVPYRSLVISLAGDIVATPAFGDIFRQAVKQAHRSVFTEDGNAVAVNLSGTLGILTSSLQVTNPDIASKIPANLDQVIIDGTDQVRQLRLWQTAEDLSSSLNALAFALVVGIVGIATLTPSWRRAGLRIGMALLATGTSITVISLLAPRLVAGRIDDPGLSGAVEKAMEIFFGDLRTLGLWTLASGVIVAALVSAETPSHQAVRPRDLLERGRDLLDRWQPTTPGARVGQALVVIAVGVGLIVARDLVVPLTVVAVGSYLGYVGILLLLGVVGRRPVTDGPGPEPPAGYPPLVRAGPSEAERRWRTQRTVWLTGVGVILVAVVATVGWVTFRSSGREAEAAGGSVCNGSADLCGRRLDQVAFAASHNSMSAAASPGWIFAQNRYGIADQLQFGIRGFLVKTHYGSSTGITVTGGDLVVTDRAAEVAVNPRVAEEELPAGAVDRANVIAGGRTANPAQRDVYLCHVQCELGAQLFTDALDEMKSFLARNPSEVLILFLGDYVSAADTQREFEAAGMLDRLWEYDPSKPAPTLQEMIDAERNILVLSEHSAPPPAWNNPGYGLFQDTPFTFTRSSDLEGQSIPASCAPNRGQADSPLFQVNHWITNSEPPSPVTAATVNAYDVLMPRVKACQETRKKFPTLIGVNFYDQGELLRVVDELNGVNPPGVR